MADYICRLCAHSWLGPWPVDGLRCPKCHGDQVDLKTKSVRVEGAPLQ